MHEVILDTNFLLIPGRFKLDIFEELNRILNFAHRVVVSDGTLRELENLKAYAKKGADKQAAKLALDLLVAKGIGVIEQPDMSVDDFLVQHASAAVGDDKVFIATQDAELKQRLRSVQVPVIVMRQRNHLEMIGWC